MNSKSEHTGSTFSSAVNLAASCQVRGWMYLGRCRMVLQRVAFPTLKDPPVGSSTQAHIIVASQVAEEALRTRIEALLLRAAGASGNLLPFVRATELR